MSRLNVSRWSRFTRGAVRDSSGWTTSGVLTASTAVKAAPGLVGGVLVTATDGDGDIDVIVWDSPDATLTLDEEVCRITGATAVANTQQSFSSPSREGIEARNGIYVEIVAGNCEVIVYYK